MEFTFSEPNSETPNVSAASLSVSMVKWLFDYKTTTVTLGHKLADVTVLVKEDSDFKRKVKEKEQTSPETRQKPQDSPPTPHSSNLCHVTAVVM